MANTHSNLSDLFTDIAKAIHDKGVDGGQYSESSTSQYNADHFNDYIRQITTGTDTSDATAVAGDILSDKTAYANGSKLTGTMTNQGAKTQTLTSQGASYTIPAGYHNGSGKVTASITSGAYSASASAAITTTPVVTPSISGKITDITSTTQPSGTDGTNYWSIDPNGSVTTTGVATATGTATIGTAGYLGTGSKTGTGTANITPSIAAGTNRYLGKAALGASGSVSVSGSGSVNPGTNTISKNSTTNISAGAFTTTKPSGYYVAIDASTAAGSGSVSVSGTGTASASVSTAGYAPTTLTGSGSVSGSGSASVTVPAKAASTTYAPIPAATITNNTSGGTSSGTINAGSQIKISKGWINSDIYYQAASDPHSSYTPSSTYFTTTNTGFGTIDANKYATSTYYIKAGAGAANTASASATGTNITLGTATTTRPSGTYITVSGSGSSKISTAGWMSTGALGTASATTYYPVSTATITNNTSGGTSSGTIPAGKQIKFGKGWNNADVYYTAQAGADISDTTATAGDVAAGKVFYTANGTRTVGTGNYVLYSEGSGAPTGTPTVGKIYRDTTTNYIYMSNGSVWELLNSWQ